VCFVRLLRFWLLQIVCGRSCPHGFIPIVICFAEPVVRSSKHCLHKSLCRDKSFIGKSPPYGWRDSSTLTLSFLERMKALYRHNYCIVMLSTKSQKVHPFGWRDSSTLTLSFLERMKALYRHNYCIVMLSTKSQKVHPFGWRDSLTLTLSFLERRKALYRHFYYVVMLFEKSIPLGGATP
jgi:hypothetical protein